MTRYRKAFIRICASVLIISSLSLGYAAAQVATGDITGRVLDPGGSVVQGATVTARNRKKTGPLGRRRAQSRALSRVCHPWG